MQIPAEAERRDLIDAKIYVETDSLDLVKKIAGAGYSLSGTQASSQVFDGLPAKLHIMHTRRRIYELSGRSSQTKRKCKHG